MKKIIIFTVVIVVLFGGIAAVTMYSNAQKAKEMEGNPYGTTDLKPATIEQLDDENYQNIILPEELEKKIEAKEDVVVYFFSSTCAACKQATPDVMAAANALDVDIQQYNVYEFEQGWTDYNIESTPTISVFENGKEVQRAVGASPNGQSDYEAFFKEYAIK